MSLNDPIAAYDAATNVEAADVAELLQNAGVPAMAIADFSQTNNWFGAGAADPKTPQVFIERTDIDRAKPILLEYVAAKKAEVDNNRERGPIKVECEECGKWSVFPENERGSVQNCPHCQAFVDVGDDVAFDGWEEAGEQDAGEEDA